jgi:hypothetical protein
MNVSNKKFRDMNIREAKVYLRTIARDIVLVIVAFVALFFL